MGNENIFLIKTIKRKYLYSTLKIGEFCFNCSRVFNKQDPALNESQKDKWDSHTTMTKATVRVTPILYENENQVYYGFPVVTDGTVHIISETAMKTPFCCFRRVDAEDLRHEKQGIFFSLSNNVIEKIKSDFGHDSYIFILDPEEFIYRIDKKHRIYSRNIHYGELTTEFAMEMERFSFPQAKIFQKAERYRWEHEYRIALLEPIETENILVKIGSIEDIAFGGNIDDLKNGFLVEGIKPI